jgi:hypothetical protein
MRSNLPQTAIEFEESSISHTLKLASSDSRSPVSASMETTSLSLRFSQADKSTGIASRSTEYRSGAGTLGGLHVDHGAVHKQPFLACPMIERPQYPEVSVLAPSIAVQ